MWVKRGLTNTVGATKFASRKDFTNFEKTAHKSPCCKCTQGEQCTTRANAPRASCQRREHGRWREREKCVSPHDAMRPLSSGGAARPRGAVQVGLCPNRIRLRLTRSLMTLSFRHSFGDFFASANPLRLVALSAIQVHVFLTTSPSANHSCLLRKGILLSAWMLQRPRFQF